MSATRFDIESNIISSGDDDFLEYEEVEFVALIKYVGDNIDTLEFYKPNIAMNSKQVISWIEQEQNIDNIDLIQTNVDNYGHAFHEFKAYDNEKFEYKSQTELESISPIEKYNYYKTFVNGTLTPKVEPKNINIFKNNKKMSNSVKDIKVRIRPTMELNEKFRSRYVNH